MKEIAVEFVYSRQRQIWVEVVIVRLLLIMNKVYCIQNLINKLWKKYKELYAQGLSLQLIRLTTAELYAPMVLDHSDNILKKARKMSRTSEKFESA